MLNNGRLATPGINVGFTYESYGRVTEMTDSTGHQIYTYDDLDSATNIATTYTGLATQNVGYSFNNDGSRSGMTASGVSFSYTYDAVGRMTGMTNPSGEATSWTYLDNNWLKTQTLQNGLVTTNTFDALGRVTRLLNAVSGSTISDFNTMNYDGVGSRTSLAASVPGHAAYGGNTTWGYDVKSQLTSEVSGRAGSFNNSFGYDDAGNPVTFKGAANTFNSNNQNSAYTWDGNGNPTTYKGATLAFDAENRLTSIPCTGGTFTAGYRGDNLRAWKNTPNGRMYFLYDGIQPVMELDSSGNVTAINTYGAAGLVSRYTNTSVRTYYAFDNQGSVAERLDNSGAVTSHSVYDAYGAFSSTASPTDPFGYEAQAGYFTDNETGLVALAFRYYDPATGRFLNRDPIGVHGGINVYGYVGNGPGGGVDEWGTNKLGIEAGGSALMGIPGFNFNIDIMVDDNGTLGVGGELGDCWGLGALASYGIGAGWERGNYGDGGVDGNSDSWVVGGGWGLGTTVEFSFDPCGLTSLSAEPVGMTGGGGVMHCNNTTGEMPIINIPNAWHRIKNWFRSWF